MTNQEISPREILERAMVRFFLGDSGAQTLGFIFAAVAILYSPLDIVQGSSWFVPIMLMGVPILTPRWLSIRACGAKNWSIGRISIIPITGWSPWA